ncbi:hypothetical protein [Salinispora oceanensis]|nr:hypothetical protein [Salinispora oceanensis]
MIALAVNEVRAPVDRQKLRSQLAEPWFQELRRHGGEAAGLM